MRQSNNQRLQFIRQTLRRYWIPLLLGILGTITVLGLWQQLQIQERLHLEQLVQQEAETIESQLNREIFNQVLALQRMAKRWQASGGIEQSLWEMDAANYIQDYRAYQAIEWVDSSFRVRWVVPTLGNESAQNLDLSQEQDRQVTLSVSRQLNQTLITHSLSLAQGGKGGFVCVPLWIDVPASPATKKRFDGFMLGVFRFQTFFDSILKPSTRYEIQVYDPTGLIYQQTETLPATTFAKSATVKIYGLDWQVRVMPTAEFIRNGRSPLPSVVLWGGLLSVWSLIFTIALGQRSERYARQAKQINQLLQAEIIHRQQIESSLRESEERWQLALRGNNDGIWDWDVQTSTLFFSNRLKEMLGLADHEMPNHLDEWAKQVHPDDLAWVMEAIQEHFDKRTPFYSTEHRVQCKDGSYKWILDRGQALWDSAGHITRMVGSYSDITERKQTELDLRDSERNYRHLIDHMNAGFIVHAPDTQILQCNTTACEMLGISMEQLLGKVAIDPSWHFVREDGSVMPAAEYPVNQVISTREPLKKYVVGISKGGDRLTWVLVTAFPEFDRHHQLKQVVVTFIDISDRKSAEIALKNSQARFAGILEIASDAIISVDANQQITLFNKGAEQIFGYTAAEVLGQPLAMLLPDRFTQAHHDHVTQYAQTNNPARPMSARSAIFGRRRDGTEFPAEASISKLTLNGEVTFTTFLRDITERRHGEEALRQSEATTRALIQTIPDLLIRMRSDGTYIDFVANPDFNIFNPSKFYKNVNIYDILGADLARRRMHYTQQALLTGTVQVYEQVLMISDKQYCEEVRIVPLMQDEVLVMIRDITDRKQVEEDLRQQKEMLQTIVDHIPVMIALFNAQGQVEFINPELEKVLGWPLEDWQQHDISTGRNLDRSDRQCLLDHLLAAMDIWRDLTTLNAAQQQLETSWVTVKLSNGRFLGIGQDISDRKRKESALRQAMEAAEAANLAKSTFLANMSHELRTPLNVILGFAQVMAHDTSLSSNQKNDLRSIHQSADHLLNLINEVLDLSKIEAGHCTLEESGLDLIALLHTLRDMMAERAAAKQLQFTLEIAPEVPQFVVADEQKLRQILLNLLSNAIKFTQQGNIILRAKIQFSEELPSISKADDRLERDPQFVLQFDVVDSGVGIAPGEQGIIFDAFVQAEAGKKSASGTGLGLTISRKLLELMQGTLAVYSSPSQGSTFTITLPVYAVSSVHTQPKQSDRLVLGLLPGQPRPRILIVDDQRENRLVLVRLLTQVGMEVKEAASGMEAIQIWQEWHPDLTWMDIRMPEMDGYEATKQIRAMEHETASIIIALTAQASQSDRTLALTAGCNDYISKPFRQETLFLKLKEYLGLEYLYAEPSQPTLTQSFSLGIKDNFQLDPAILSLLSADWLDAVERAAICGNDRAIANLAVQLPPELLPMANQIMNFANQFQFEKILAMIHREPC